MWLGLVGASGGGGVPAVGALLGSAGEYTILLRQESGRRENGVDPRPCLLL